MKAEVMHIGGLENLQIYDPRKTLHKTVGYIKADELNKGEIAKFLWEVEGMNLVAVEKSKVYNHLIAIAGWGDIYLIEVIEE